MLYCACSPQNCFYLYLKVYCTNFVVEDKFPPNSPDINPLDCYVWGAADILLT